MLFLSMVIASAVRPVEAGSFDTGHQSRYWGLSLNASDHQWEWIPKEHRLHSEDVIILQQREDWFTNSAHEMSEACIRAIPSMDDSTGSYLITATAALEGAPSPSHDASLWADGQTVDTIVVDAPAQGPGEMTAARRIAIRLSKQNSRLAAFLDAWVKAQMAKP